MNPVTLMLPGIIVSIVFAFLIGVLVYFSIEQGIEIGRREEREKWLKEKAEAKEAA